MIENEYLKGPCFMVGTDGVVSHTHTRGIPLLELDWDESVPNKKGQIRAFIESLGYKAEQTLMRAINSTFLDYVFTYGSDRHGIDQHDYRNGMNCDVWENDRALQIRGKKLEDGFAAFPGDFFIEDFIDGLIAGEGYDPLGYAAKRSAIVIYDLSAFEEAGGELQIFKDPQNKKEALIGVVVFRWEPNYIERDFYRCSSHVERMRNLRKWYQDWDETSEGGRYATLNDLVTAYMKQISQKSMAEEKQGDGLEKERQELVEYEKLIETKAWAINSLDNLNCQLDSTRAAIDNYNEEHFARVGYQSWPDFVIRIARANMSELIEPWFIQRMEWIIEMAEKIKTDNPQIKWR
ncbi:MAG: hypothetical protein PHH14_01250 [Candidatus Margulisbacteria bacterium]|nr:hypothetical protein [Candidatus Margulisiibacteriota bacterium]